MRTHLLIVCCVLGAASIAHADPEPSLFASAGLQVGGSDDLLIGGGAVELDKRLHEGLWLHSTFAAGSTAMLFAQGSGNYEQLRAGVEGRMCTASGIACAFAGLDVGFQHAAYAGTETPFYFGGGDDTPAPQMLSMDYLDPMVVPRLGADIGKTIRFRPAIEVPITPEGAGLAVTMAVAVQL